MIKSEQIAKVIIGHIEGKCVYEHDIGTSNGMYDLRIGDKDNPEAAIEVTRLVDKKWMDLWYAGPEHEPRKIQSQYAWKVGIENKFRIKQNISELNNVIQQMEALGLSTYWRFKDFRRPWRKWAQEVGVQYIRISTWLEPGELVFSMVPTAFTFNEMGIGVSDEITAYLHSDKCRDNRDKLGKSNSHRRELFIFTGITGVAPRLESYVHTNCLTLPPDTPKLPHEITAIWIVSRTCGLYFQDHWLRFDSYEEQVEKLLKSSM